MTLNWSKTLSTDISEIDEQHRELFDRFNSFLAAMAPEKREEELQETFKFLEEYIITHFSMEEGFMEQFQYPEIKAHKALHKDFIEKLTSLKEKSEKEGATLSIMVEMNRFISNWLIQHISTVDKELGAFLKDKM